MRALWLFIATAAFSGYVPFAPGTVGSAVGLLVWWACRSLGGAWVDGGVIVALSVLGARAGTEAERHFAREDPGHVVIDEVVGMLVTLVTLPVSWTGALAGFVLFRVFDVVKPWPASRFERLPGGIGIMADDIMAGVYAHLALRIAGAVWPAWVYLP
jgi:phosphatidylglycerophosphatase A